MQEGEDEYGSVEENIVSIVIEFTMFTHSRGLSKRDFPRSRGNRHMCAHITTY